MKKKLIFLITLTLLAVYGVIPSIIYFTQPAEIRNNPELLAKKIPSWLPSSHIKLGLDLQGGVLLVLGVNVSEALDNKLSRIGTETMRWAEDEGYIVKTAYVVKDKKLLRVEVDDSVDTGSFKVDMTKEFLGLSAVAESGTTIDFEYKAEQVKSIEKGALEQAERVVRNRIDKWGVAEPDITRRTDGNIIVQLPGFGDPKKAKELLGRTAQLKFKIVDDEFKGFDAVKDLPEGVQKEGSQFVSEDKEKLVTLLGSLIPEDRELLFEEEQLAGGKKVKYKSIVVMAATELSGEDVLDAAVVSDSSGYSNRPAVSMKLTGTGGKRFADITGQNIHKRMAIILDDVVTSAPVIQTRIAGGSAQITLGSGSYNEILEEANNLTFILKSGALPATIQVLEERQVGASLGPELAKQGIYSIMVGVLLILMFMVVYYVRSGLIACLILLLNGVFLFAIMAGFGFALTLPGIAGFVLSLGVAVDANILINERIRQELNSGRSARFAVSEAFKKVLSTIVDSNLTSLIAAFVLLENNSSGPIRGFAVTLTIGILVSLFTSIYCNKILYNFALRNVTTDSGIRAWFASYLVDKRIKETHINFLSFSKISATIATLLAVAILASCFVRGLNWSVDFAGGSEIELTFEKAIEPDQLRKTAADLNLSNLTLQSLGQDDNKDFLLKFEAPKTQSDDEQAQQAFLNSTKDKLTDALSDYGVQIMKIDYVGPKIGSELRSQGLTSMLLTIAMIFLYILLRFDMRFAPGAVLKMTLDTVVAIGFFAFFWRSFDLTSIAAILTVIGYSINDTIVIYDRVRENFTLFPKKDSVSNINTAINETLSRTINTSLTSILSLVGVLIFASGQLWNFAATMVIGIISATLSSIFIGCPAIIWISKIRAYIESRKSKASSL